VRTDTPPGERAGTPSSTAERRLLRLGLDAEPQLRELAERIAGALEERLRDRFPTIDWKVEVTEGHRKDPQARIAELARAEREAMLNRGDDLAICLTDIPLRSRRRALTAVASASDGVALISVPALGPLDVESKLVDTALGVIEALVGEGDGRRNGDRRKQRVRDRLHELASPHATAEVHDDRTVRFSGAVVLGNLRLLLGMVRANRPWRFAAKLSRVVVAALGTAAYVLASAGFWTLAHHMTWQRLLALSVAAVAITSTALITAHDLWERSHRAQTRERVVLFNAVTTLTVVIGVLTLYAGLGAFSVVGAFALVPEGALEEQIGREAVTVDFLKLAWLGASLATLAGALGSLVDSDLAVRDAAYSYWSSD
jgi:uncharacterized membrane protein